MKLYLIFPVFALSAVLFSCGGDPVEFSVERVIKNNSSVEVRLDVYKNSDVFESLVIDSGDENRKAERCRSRNGPKPFSCDLLSSLEIRWLWQDSVVINFANLRSQTYCIGLTADECGAADRLRLHILPMTENERNLGFEREMVDGVRVYTYTITEADYENAEQIGG